MRTVKNNDLQIEELSRAIEEVRRTLNEVCSTSENHNDEIRLNISRYLDELIVEYMRQVKHK